ncbi:hypothetical protein MPH_04309 [Macrophomina phaseolina MS6]|uniref:Dimeric alpha-beta barrel n=1 Tax=Macrophomina phaseolina (strain MS6) TaxID=1126212 RepID=K2S0N7_MACPH|nr:hypothetical protein MPH_04309 [Macrophomina phaseolina MS6]
MPTPGLLYVGSAIKDPVLTEDVFIKWYDEVHIPEVLATGFSAAFRYKNTNASADFPNLVLYTMPDLDLFNPDMKNAKMSHDTLPGGRSHFELCNFDTRVYEKIQTFEGQIPKEGRAAKCIIAVALEPAEGEEADKDFDSWYRLQHLDMLSTVSGYRRSTRYKLKLSPTAEAAGKDLPRYLALHEYDRTDIPQDQIKLAVGTEWSKKVIAGAKAFVRDVYVLQHEAGDAAVKL